MIFKRKKESAEELLRTETGFIRYLRPYENMLVSFIAVSWAVYQLALASVLILDSTQQRTIHLAFAMSLLFLVNPCLKRSRKYLHFLSIKDHIPIIDYIFAVVGAMAALYLVFDYEAIAMRRSGLEHVLLGSIAEKMIRHSPVPVLTFRSKKT